MTKNLYKPVLAGAFLIASTGMSAFGQYYPSQGYGYSQSYQNQPYGSQQLGNLVAPIALYPDSLLSQVLVASTYPLQLAEASQWISQIGYLQGEQRLEAAREQNWDPSVQALVAFPDVLQRLTQDPQWTAELGNAFLNNQGAVMNAVQELRARAQQSGRLQSTPQLTVNVENYNGERAIDIVPTNPEVVYVPDYDPAYIWGAPAYGYYPSLYYPSFGFGFGGGIAIGAFFGGGYGGGFGHWGWGSNWRDRRVIVNNDFFYRNRFNGYRDGRFSSGSNVWRHDESRGNSLNGGYAGRQQNFGRGNSYQQPAYTGNNYQQQGFRSGQTNQRFQNAPQQQSGRQQYSATQNSVPQARGFQSAPQQQYSRPQYSDPQTRSFQSAPQQQYSRQQNSAPQQTRSFQSAPQQQYSRQQYSAPQQTRSFQSAPQQQYSRQQYSAPQQTRSLQSAPQQQYSRQQSQPQAQQSEQRSFSGNSGGGHGRR